MERNAGTSMQSLPPRPLALPPSLSAIQHSLSLNGTRHRPGLWNQNRSFLLQNVCLKLDQLIWVLSVRFWWFQF